MLETTRLTVIKRNGDGIPFNAEKIRTAILKSYKDPQVSDSSIDESTAITEKVLRLTEDVVKRIVNSGNSSIPIEDIQDWVEESLMAANERLVMRAYVLHRERHSQERQSTTAPRKMDQRLVAQAQGYCQGLTDVQPERLAALVDKAKYDGITENDVRELWVMEARTLIETEPNYSYVAARIVLDSLTQSAYRELNLPLSGISQISEQSEPDYFETYIREGISRELLSPALADYDLPRLATTLDAGRDEKFTYLAIQTLVDRYFIHSNDIRIELPQAFFMRVSMGLALNETDKNDRAIEFYHLLSSFDFMSSTPTLFNAGTLHPQLSSCYLSTVPDDLYGIYGALTDNAMLSKYAGGLGNDWTPVRALNAYIKGTNGKSQGVVPFLKVANDGAVAVNQGGKRKGAVCAYLETWHLDIEEFLELRKNTGDDRRRTHDMNTANWVPDLFMKRVFQDKQWTLFSPNDTPELHDLYGQEFEETYEAYERKAQSGELALSKTVNAVDLWRKMLGMLFETGHPWIAFKDACNIRNPQQHAGVIHSSNLCTEITLNTSADEIAVCNLGSVNLVQHIVNGEIDKVKLRATVTTAIRMLDNVIDINLYPVEKARHSNMRHRPIGLGLMGFHDALVSMNVPYASEEAVLFADTSTEIISYYAIEASCGLAEERGAYSSYNGSLWSQGILPIDSIALLKKSRGEFLDMNTESFADMPWDTLRTNIARFGMRNSNVMAIAPTATIANITGVSQSIEPHYQNLYVKSNLSGEFTVINHRLVDALKALGMWDSAMLNDLKFYEGSLTKIARIPDAIKTVFKTAFEIDSKFVIESASRRQKWIDQAQSLNVYMPGANGKMLDKTYKMAWLKGLKTTYYLRTKAATSTEKSTINASVLNAVAVNNPKACAIDDPECEACQ